MTTQTNRPRDARAFAKRLIARYGEQAIPYANYQSLRARQRGDDRMMQRWQWIAGAAAEILRTEPEKTNDPSC